MVDTLDRSRDVDCTVITSFSTSRVMQYSDDVWCNGPAMEVCGLKYCETIKLTKN